MTTRVKICGITTAVDLSVAIRAGADAIGVIADIPVDSPRTVSPEKATELIASVPPFVSSVLVTMPETTDTALALYDRVQPDVMQLHGDVPESVLTTVSAHTTLIRAVAVTDRDAIDVAQDYADALLIDSLDASGAGGTGETHDWERTKQLVDTVDIPVILAGGLTPDNVRAAIETVRPFAVDVASGVEHGDGKDHTKVRQFIKTVQATQKMEI